MKATTSATPEADSDLKRFAMTLWMAGVKPGQLAKRCGIPRHRISDLLRGKNRSWELRRAVNVALGMRVFTKAGSQPPAPVPSVKETLGFELRCNQPEAITALKFWMIQNGISVGALAKKAGITPHVLSNILADNNHCFPPRAKINKATEQTFFQKPVRHNKR